MKIALIGTRGIPPRYGGSETYVEQLALNLAAHGDQVWVYGAPENSSTPGESNSVSYPSSIHRIEVPSLHTKHADNFLRSLLSTIHVCFNREVEIVEFVNVGPAFFAFLPRIFGKKVVGAIRAMDSRREKWGRLASTFLRLCERLIYIVPHATTANSQAIVDYYADRHNALVHFIPNGISIVTPPPHPAEIKKWGLIGGDYILFAARLVPEKGCHVLVEAFRRTDWPRMKLVIAGGDSFSPEYAKQLRILGDDRTLFVGHVSGIALDELFANAYAFVLPSSVEGMSNSLLSAMAYGRPVIVSDIPENLAVIPDSIKNKALGGTNDWSFKLGDVENLAKKLSVLRDRPSDMALIGKDLQAHAKASFSWEASTLKVRSIYLRLLDEET